MSDILWTADELLSATGGRFEGAKPSNVTGLSIDTRTLNSGDAYLAIKGDVHDGHKFVANAVKAGAVVSIVAADWLDRLEGETGCLLVVDDVLSAMEKMGIAARARTEAKIVAVTGSVGKTTTKETLRLALAPSGKVHAAVASFNNHWGVPLTLARMPRDTDFGIIEIGMNHPGEITPLVKMASPHVSMIMNVAAVHLGAFKDVDEIAIAKSEIFAGLLPDGTAILNADDERLAIMEAEAAKAGVENIVYFGKSEKAQTRLTNLVLHNTCSCLSASVFGTDMVVKVGAPGAHIAHNVLAVLSAVELMGGDLAKAGLALAKMEAVKGRGQRHILELGSGRAVLIDESYNANPTSMRAAIDLLAAAELKGSGRHIAVMGDMLELGPTSGELHAGLAGHLKNAGVSNVFLAGPEMKLLADKLDSSIKCVHANEIDDLIEPICSVLRDGDVLMAKASLGMKFAKLIDALKRDFTQAERD